MEALDLGASLAMAARGDLESFHSSHTAQAGQLSSHVAVNLAVPE